MMSGKAIKQPFEISLQETTEGEHPSRQASAFELVYVLDGSGQLLVNENRYTFRENKLYLFTPDDQYNFDTGTAARLLLIRFSDLSFSLLESEAARVEFCDWMKKVDYIFHNYHGKAGCIFRDKEDEQFAHALLTAIVREHLQQAAGHMLVIRQSVSVLLNLVARNLAMSEPLPAGTNAPGMDVIRIIAYLQQHIYEPDALKLKNIAAHFNRSVHYIGDYFRDRTGQSIQEYIIDYKLKLVDTRLAYSDMRISEIAAEFRFTDESYLTKLFKKYRGMTPRAYRKTRKLQ